MKFALAFLILVSSARVLAESPSREISVSGVCNRNVVPDRGAITVTAEITDMDLKKASQTVTSQYETLKKAVAKLQLKNAIMSTSEYTLQTVTEWKNNESVFKGYKARMGLRVVSSEISRLGEVIQLAADQNIRDVGQLSTFLSTEKFKTEHDGCLEEAVKDARAKAEKIAGAAEVNLGHVIQVNESSGVMMPLSGGRMHANNLMAVQGSAPEPPSVDAGTQPISVNVSASFAIQ